MSRRWMPIAICSLVALDAGSGVRCLSAEEKVAEKIIAQEPIAPAASEGQADLDAALQEKVSVEDLRGLNHVIELLESALDKGLDVENSDFAESLLSGSRLERAAQLHNVLKRVPSDQLSDPRMSEVRRMAISDLRFVLTFDNPPPQTLAMLAQLLAMPGGDSREAQRLLEKLFQHKDVESIPAPDRAESLVLRASLQTKVEKARADYDAAIALAPRAVAVRLARAEFRRLQKEYDAALEDVAAVIEREPDNAAGYLLRSQVERSQGKMDAAAASAAKASEFAPAATGPLQASGEIYREQKEYPKAIEQFTKVLELQPGNLLALIHRAEAYLGSEQFDLALTDVDVVLKGQPNLVLAHALRAQILANLKRMPEAIEEMQRLAEAAPQDADYKMQLALYYLVDEQPAQAIEQYTAVLAVEANNVLALRSRGDAYLGLGDHAAAVADFEQALLLEPEDSALLNNFAWVLATSPDDAVRNGKRAVELASKAVKLTEEKKPHILSTLAAAFAESGDFDLARKWSKQAVSTRDEEATEAAAKEMAEQLSKELTSYEANKPWREKQPEKEKSSASKPADDAGILDQPVDEPPAKAADKPAAPAEHAASQSGA